MLTGLNANTAQHIQLGAGALLKQKYVKGTKLTAEQILSATNGGITINLVPTFFTPTIDGNFENVKGTGKTVTNWAVTVTTTVVEASKDVVLTALGCADESEDGVITGRHTVKPSDYKDFYVIGERGDGAIIQVTIKNGMNTSGLSLATANNGNGGISLTITGNYDVNNLDEPPFEIEIIVPAED